MALEEMLCGMENGIGRVTLNCPEPLNSITQNMVHELNAAMAKVA